MTPPLDAWSEKRRRTLLQLVGASATASALQGVLDAVAADAAPSVVVEQGDRCVELAPLSGDQPVEDLYDYAYPTDRFDGPPGSRGDTFSSEGTTDLQRDRTSVLFLYDGPEGLSLVVVHGRLDGDRDAGGTATFTFDGLPDAASWVVRDDHYLEDGEPAASNFDRWDLGGNPHVVNWAYRAGRTDGGALRGLGSEFEIIVEPAFNDDAALAADHDYGPIEAWEALSGDRDAPDRIPLRLDRPVTIRTGTCDGKTAGGGAAGDDDRGKHEKKQEKHRKEREREQTKHEKKQEKHRKEQEREQTKHEKKQQKHKKQQRKHRKHGG